MNREIKFRFWTGTKMVQPVKWADLLIKGDGRIMLWDDIAENSGLTDVSSENIIPLQYTGLKDKNGKEIYEGDLYQIPNLPLITISYCTEEADYNYGWNFGRNDGEVIGNIYENPDLLNQ